MKKLHMKLTTLTLASALFLTSFADVPAVNAIKKKLRLSKNSLTLQTGPKKSLQPHRLLLHLLPEDCLLWESVIQN